MPARLEERARLAALEAEKAARVQQAKRLANEKANEGARRAAAASHAKRVEANRSEWGPEGPILDRIAQLLRVKKPDLGSDGVGFGFVKWAVLWFISITLAYGLISGLTGDAEAHVPVVATSYVGLGVLAVVLWLREATAPSRYERAQREIASLRERLGCGDVTCRACAGT